MALYNCSVYGWEGGFPELSPFPLAPWAPKDRPSDRTWLYDGSRPARVATFFERVLVHPRDGSPFVLANWQLREIIQPLFGTVHYDDHHDAIVRQFSVAWVEIARKNGKSELLAGLALYLLCADGQNMAEVYGAACDVDQARLVFNTAKAMVAASPYLSKRLKVVDSQRRIVYPSTNSVYRVIPADAGGNLGLNPTGIVFDEILTQPNRELWDALKTAMGARRDALMVAATTAAYTTAKFALEEHRYGLRVAANPAIDPQRFVFIRNTPEGADWRVEGVPADPEAGVEATGWYAANPALGDFLNVNTLRAEAREASEKPQAQNAFRVFRLNQWTSQASRWLDMSVYRERNEPRFDGDYPGLFDGRPAFYGLDIGSNRDFTSYVLLFNGSPDDPDAPGFTVLPRFYVPRNAFESRSKDREELGVWRDSGLVNVTAGQTTDYDAIERGLAADAQRWPIIHIGYDPFQAGHLIQHLDEMGLSAVKIPQIFSRLTTPTKMLEDSVVRREFYHAGNPVLDWMADNVELDVTADGQYMKPSKRSSGDKIDGVAATVNALYCTMIPEETVEETPKVTFIAF